MCARAAGWITSFGSFARSLAPHAFLRCCYRPVLLLACMPHNVRTTEADAAALRERLSELVDDNARLQGELAGVAVCQASMQQKVRQLTGLNGGPTAVEGEEERLVEGAFARHLVLLRGLGEVMDMAVRDDDDANQLHEQVPI